MEELRQLEIDYKNKLVSKKEYEYIKAVLESRLLQKS